VFTKIDRPPVLFFFCRTIVSRHPHWSFSHWNPCANLLLVLCVKFTFLCPRQSLVSPVPIQNLAFSHGVCPTLMSSLDESIRFCLEALRDSSKPLPRFSRFPMSGGPAHSAHFDAPPIQGFTAFSLFFSYLDAKLEYNLWVCCFLAKSSLWHRTQPPVPFTCAHAIAPLPFFL